MSAIHFQRRQGGVLRRRGFTLLETSLAIIIIGVGVLAIIQAQQSFLQKNAWSTHSSTAAFLANEIREMTRGWPKHDPLSGGLYFENPEAFSGFQGWGPGPNELTLEDYNDLDDLDGVVFGDAPNIPGPINRRHAGPISAFRDVITDTDWAGLVILDEDGDPAPLRGWTQYVRVQKIDPTDFTQTVANDHHIPEGPGQPAIAVDQFPLRVTVHILYQGDLDAEAIEITRVTWIVP
ncbi:MAG: prepilin-type N-terminal cleavage/methylation domain-containing protein [Phycisphaeraceae bacterium]|nr:MAG: prepilin-type N-terminal cleavage/methylation domain-containing protein [Phycisphaeraceae bacterium]